ncbi:MULTISPECIES: serine/threonine-protein kinase [unclassified Streptomyces]|uniref:serine/threonine-protein kinase n=1 Tax=unclassified Streptomyces TaxID=2593676 RepID=UPI002366462C|nr:MULTISPECIES: serine/threonine-protein kinase [unclassified Streptomyces]MDF3145684.1 PQQ-binding-like beta-propeller repeat protein [Streptomyces sp. T21Q-yed]WDF37526.1 PQQ-binding-like beta-propeller repeat protein [Streptomyces sp. T12]
MPLHRDDPKSVGGYKLVDRLGAGGMGIVYRGRARSGREVAVKVVHAQYAEDEVFRARFLQEIESVRKVSGAFTAPVVDADPEAVRPWMATQYVPGRSLADRIREQGALRGGELRQVALGLVEALREIHRAGVVHRDLKPANVLMAEDGPRVIDFGISRAAENHHTLTETGQMIGTPPFMSPEQLTDARKVGPASDVFSLGALLVFCVTGRGPFDADSPYLTAYRVVHDEPVLEGVAGPLRAVLERCLAKDTKDRPGLDELAHEFAAVLPEPAEGDPPTMTRRPGAPRAGAETDPGIAVGRTTAGSGRRSRTRPLWAAVGTVGVLGLGLLGYMRYGPGFADDPPSVSPDPAAASAAPRWAALPAGWKPWQTGVTETAASGVTKAPDVNGADVAPHCAVDQGSVYCGGNALLPERIDGATGKTLWRAGIAPAGIPADRYTSTVVGVDGDVVLVQLLVNNASGFTQEQSLVALDRHSGEELWSRKVYNGSPPSIDVAGLVLMQEADGRTVTARSAADGKERWKIPLPAKHFCTLLDRAERPYVECVTDSADDDTQFIVIDPADGSVRRLASPADSGSFVGALDGKLLFVESDAEADVVAAGRDLTYTRIVRVDPESGKRAVTELPQRYRGTVALARGTLYFSKSTGQVTAASPLTGVKVWETRTTVESPGQLSVDAGGRTAYVASGSGRVAALDAARGTLLWESSTRAEVLASGITPVVLFDRGALVVAAADGTIFTLDPAHPDRTPVSAG